MKKTDFWYDETNKYDALTGEAKDVDRNANAMHKGALLRAVGNFVNIVTGESIPVKFNTKDSSYTDGKTVVIGGNISEKNFDHVVGLALHEGSHCLLTDFNQLKYMEATIRPQIEAYRDKYNVDLLDAKWSVEPRIKDLLNVIEDRRIDMHIYRNAPGYRGYYDAMYNKYFNARVIDKALKNNEKVDPDWDSYMFHIINITNKHRNLDALPVLRQVWNLIDLKNIERLKSTYEALEVAIQIYDLIEATMPVPPSEDEDCESQCQNGEDGTEDGESNQGQSNCSSGTPAQPNPKLDKAIQKQKEFMRGKSKKSSMSKKAAQQAEAIAKSKISDYTVDDLGTAIPNKFSCRVIERVTDQLFDNDLITGMYKHNRRYEDAVNRGISLGRALGRKLQVRNRETVETTHRLRKGKLDGRAIARLGFNDPSVFAKTVISQHNDENVHITIDASGSMAGKQMSQTLTASAAIAQALKMTTNMHLTVSIRTNEWNSVTPTVVMIYDSKVNNIAHIRKYWPAICANSDTPESLCFDAIAKHIPANSLIINFSDGMPGASNYHGFPAREHVRKSVNKWKAQGFQVLSYFIKNAYTSDATAEEFIRMFGKDSAQDISVDQILPLAQTLNKAWANKA